MRNPLLDKDFLKALDYHREKETYAKTLNYWLTTDETKIILEVRW